jgi:energy-coupling factor transporter ATP-binding protein EcfA2
MKIDSLIIENFRGIQKVEARALGDTIIIAGQNGSGKSCIFDAIRLLKSTYGGYQQNEWQHFFNEFAIQLHGSSKNLRGLFNDSTKPTVIECIFQLRDNEKSYIHGNAASLLEETIWQMLLPEAFQYGGYTKALFANQFRERQPEVSRRVEIELPNLLSELTAPNVIGRVQISPDGGIIIKNSLLLSVIFTNYKPRQIGVIDFHGAQRHYGRENVQGINLSLEQANQQYSQHTLYNYNNKYNNVKSEMAGNFIKELLAEKASTDKHPPSSSLSETLKELFQSFFPEKQFLGPQPTPDGSLTFPVITPSGTEHDLDELSSGEKEILYGYLRIRSSAPRDSIILLDEPELHLNPRLIRGLPEFYRKHLGEALQNQLWLVT